MTEQELEILRLKMQIQALQVLIRGIYTGVAGLSPTAPIVLREKFAALRKETDKIAIKGVLPEYSDMVSGEYQTAMDDLLSFIETGLRK